MAMGGNKNSSRRRQRHDAFTEINVTPFVDVMLVLLVIFMVTAPMMTAGVNVDLPKSAAKAIQGDDEPISISITTNGKIYLQKNEIRLEEIEPKLRAVAGQKSDTRIFVRGDQAVDYGRIMQVVGAINAAGFGKVSLITESGTPVKK
jgi:biopolymer transport protein TolR